MSTWSSYLNSITMRPECAISDAIESWSIKTQKRIDLRRPASFRKKMAHATQISLAFFTDCSHKQDRTLDGYLLVLNCQRYRKQSCEPTPIVGDSRSEQLFAAPGNSEVRICREDGIEMCAHDEQRRW